MFVEISAAVGLKYFGIAQTQATESGVSVNSGF